MSDNLDHASEHAGLHLQQALNQRRPDGPSPTGRCHWCDEILDDEMRFCDAECRDNFEGRKK